ncbi:hypothetical protein [Legionella birminghamensis]|nr:hypothetical protein [Legionella birminghamensis]
MHFLTPEIVAECIQRGSDSSRSIPELDDAYERLKKTFADYYLEGEELSWLQLSNLLQKYNPFDQQILLGPVLRRFMAGSMKANADLPAFFEDEAALNGHITEISEPQPQLQNRYDSADPHHVSAYIAEPLGITFTYHRQGEKPKRLEAKNSIVSIDVYHEGGIQGAGDGGHWERTANASERVRYEKEADSRLKYVVKLFRDDPDITLLGFELLKQHIRLMHEGLSAGLDTNDELKTLDLLAAQVVKFNKLLLHMPKDLALQVIDPKPHSQLEAILTHIPEFAGEDSPEIVAAVKIRLQLRHEKKTYILPGDSELNTMVNEIMKPVELVAEEPPKEEDDFVLVAPSSPEPLPRQTFFHSSPKEPLPSPVVPVLVPEDKTPVVIKDDAPIVESVIDLNSQFSSGIEFSTPGMPGPIEDKMILDEFEDLFQAIYDTLQLPVSAHAICQAINLANELHQKIVGTVQKDSPSVAVNRQDVENILNQLKLIYPNKMHIEDRSKAQMWRACALELTNEFAPRLFRSASSASIFGNNLTTLLDLTTDAYEEIDRLTERYKDSTKQYSDSDYGSKEYKAHQKMIEQELPEYNRQLEQLSQCPVKYKPVVKSAVKSVLNYIELPPLARLQKLQQNLAEAIKQLEQFRDSIDLKNQSPLQKTQLEDIEAALLKFNACQIALEEDINTIQQTGITHHAGLLLVKYNQDLREAVQETVLNKPSLAHLHSGFEKFARIVLKILTFGIYEYKSKPRQAVAELDADQILDISSGLHGGPSAA